jgi:hypothetical protein
VSEGLKVGGETEASSPPSRAEVVSAIVIALSGLLIAFAEYQSDLWSGEENVNLSRASILYTQAARTWNASNARQSTNVQLFSHWLDATTRGDHQLAAFYTSRIPPELKDAFDAWIAMRPLENPAAPFSPLGMPQYTPPGSTEAKALERQGDEAFHKGQHAKRLGDSFSQAGTVFSMALFFAGISQVFRARSIRNALLALAVVACALGVFRLATLPLQTLFSMPG